MDAVSPQQIKELIMEYKQFQSGQKVKNQYGDILTVLCQVGCQVFVEEECNSHYHPSKLFPKA
jgi:hypothetical protein